MRPNRSVDADTLRQGTDHLCVERPLSQAVPSVLGLPLPVTYSQRSSTVSLLQINNIVDIANIDKRQLQAGNSHCRPRFKRQVVVIQGI